MLKVRENRSGIQANFVPEYVNSDIKKTIKYVCSNRKTEIKSKAMFLKLVEHSILKKNKLKTVIYIKFFKIV